MSPALEHFVSWLFVPGHRPDRFVKAAASGADIVIIDLEDAVPSDKKAEARSNAVDYCEGIGAGPVAVRINGPGQPDHDRDVAALAGLTRPVVVVVPKVESGDDVQRIREACVWWGSAVQIVALVESAAGVLAMDSILAAAPAALMIGDADLSADLGCDIGASVHRGAVDRVLLHAAANGTPVFASPCFDITNVAVINDAATFARRNGSVGMAAIHPAQVAPIAVAFTPTPEDVAWATSCMRIDGAGSLDGHMVDEAVLRRARRVLARAASPRNSAATERSG